MSADESTTDHEATAEQSQTDFEEENDSTEYMFPSVSPEPNVENDIEWSPAPGQIINVCPGVNVRRSSHIAEKSRS